MSQWEGNVGVKVSMHGCISEYAGLVNAEVDSMGGIVDGGVGIGTKTSPRRAAIEKAQAELRQEYDVREERRRELDFLEKGGNPLDFRTGHAASLSVQSTSLTDQHPEQFVNIEAKGSFAITASSRGDSVESCGRPGAPPACEPNSADNLMLFDGENEFLERERNSLLPDRSNVAPSEQSSQLDGSQNAKESGDSAAFGLPRKAYKRRYRSRPIRDGTHSCSTDVIPSRCGLGSCAPSRPCPEDVKGFLSDADCQKKETMSSNCCPKPTSPKANTVLNTAPSKAPFDVELDRLQAVESTADTIKVLPNASPDVNASNNLLDGENDRQPQINDEEPSIQVVSQEPEFCEGREQMISSGLERVPYEATTAVENQAFLGQINGFKSAKGETKGMPNEQNSGAALSAKGLDSESSCTQISLSLDGNNDIELCTDVRNVETNGVVKEPTLVSRGSLHANAEEFVKVKTESKGEDISPIGTDAKHSVSHNNQENGSIEKIEEELNEGGPLVQNEVKCSPVKDGMEIDGSQPIEMETNTCKLAIHNSMKHNDNATNGSLQGSADLSIQGLPEAMVAVKGSAPEQQINSGINLKLTSKEQEDSVLEEARIIEANQKRIAELSVGTLPLENQQKSHWDFVLEEMAWLANDFAQERMWKIATAAQICHRVATASRLRFDEQNSNWEAKEVAHTLANAVIGFWRSAEEAIKEPEMQYPEKDSRLAVVNYAVNYLKNNSLHIRQKQAEASTMPDRIVEVGILDASWEDHLTEVLPDS